MKLLIGQYAGFCNGVRKAILKISSILKEDDTPYIHGPLIHNPQTISVLSQRGLKLMEKNDSIKNKSIVIRTHGIPLPEYKKIQKNARKCINLTCSRVARIQGLIKKYAQQGYYILITGNAEHPEVQSFISYAPEGKYCILSLKEDISNIPDTQQYLLVSQTTINLDFFSTIAAEVQKKFQNSTVKVINTICEATHNKQHEIHQAISRGIDTLVVIGGKNSSNTKHLADIGRIHSIKTLHVETENELLQDDLINSHKIFVTAGASTPDWIISNVISRLHELTNASQNWILRSCFAFLKTIFLLPIPCAVSLFFFTLFSQKLLASISSYYIAFINAITVFMIISIKDILNLPNLKYLYPLKYTYIQNYKIVLLSVCSFLTLIAVYLSYIFSTYYLIIPLIYTLGYLVVTSHGSLKKISGSFIRYCLNPTMLLSLVCALLIISPLLLHIAKFPIQFLYIGIFFLILLVSRGLILEMMTYQADKIFGNYTFLTEIGKKNGELFFYIANALLVLFTISISFYLHNYLILSFLPVTLYQIIYYRIVMKKNYGDMLLHEIISDIPLLLVSALFFIL